MKKISELTGLRFRVVLIFLALLVSVGYLVFCFFKFYKIANSLISDYDDDDDDDDDETKEEEKPKPKPKETAKPIISDSINGQPKEPQPATV